MADFPTFPYSKKAVNRAGKALANDILWSDDRAEEIHEIFNVANKWRNSHAYPMRILRYELLGSMSRSKSKGISAARLKRMPSIRRKLQKYGLDQIQDLGGCRAIVSSIKDLNGIVDCQRNGSAHHLYGEDDYIKSPKQDGYRCHHLMYKFIGADQKEQDYYANRRIELQVRTRLQHSWATAVEAVGLSRGEDFKAGLGNIEWRRLFQLISVEFAIAEKCPEANGLPTRRERIADIIDLDKRVNALGTLQALRDGIRFVDNYVQGFTPKYYLIKYDHRKREVTAQPFSAAIVGADSLDMAEVALQHSSDGINAVLVEADAIDTLIAAYPNYFGDVSMFITNLLDITRGGDAKEYTMPPQQRVPAPPKEVPDMSWFRQRNRRWEQ